MTLTEFLDKIDETAKAAIKDSEKRFEAIGNHINRMDPPTTLALTAALRKCVEALERIEGIFNGTVGDGIPEQRDYYDIACECLSSLSESFKEMK